MPEPPRFLHLAAAPADAELTLLRQSMLAHRYTREFLLWNPGIWAEAFWATLQAEVLDRQHLADLAAADAAVTAYAAY